MEFLKRIFGKQQNTDLIHEKKMENTSDGDSLEAEIDTPIKHITGIVNSSGMGGGRARGEEFWTYRFVLLSWYDVDGIVREEPLKVWKKVSDDQRNVISGSVERESTVRFTYNDQVTDGSVEMIDVIEIDFRDDKLDSYVEEVRRDITYMDHELGEFMLNKSIHVYTKPLDWCGVRAELFMETDNEKILKEYIDIQENLQ